MQPTDEITSDAVVIPQRLLTLPEAARYLSCKLWAVRELIWKGQLPYTRFGKRFQVDVKDLDELVEREKRCEGNADPSRVSASGPKKLIVPSASNGKPYVRASGGQEEETAEFMRPKPAARVGV